MKNLIFSAVLFLPVVFCIAQDGLNESKLLELAGDLRVHDPVIIHPGETYYLCRQSGLQKQA